jgi:hypothetical protein
MPSLIPKGSFGGMAFPQVRHQRPASMRVSVRMSR